MRVVLRIALFLITVVAVMAALIFLLDLRLVRPAKDTALDQLRALPYLEFGDDAADAELRDVVVYDKEAAFDGYNLYGEILIDMQGRRVNDWGRHLVSGLSNRLNIGALLEDGSVLAWELVTMRLVKLDWNSSPLWKSDFQVHHEIVLTPESTLLVPTNRVYEYQGRRVEFDDLLELSQDLEVISRWSTWEHFDELRKLHEPLPLDLDADQIAGMNRRQPTTLKKSPFGGDYDYYHLNSIQPLPETPLGNADRRFQTGNLLISLRNVDLILILDRATREIVWSWGPGVIQRQHMPRMLPGGRILVFDNGRAQRGFSRVIELDPLSQEIVWEYRADPPESFYTRGQGSAQRLGNGNTLIAESHKGRAFEVTADGRIVWEWFNPKFKKERRAKVYRMIRIRREKVDRVVAEQTPQ